MFALQTFTVLLAFLSFSVQASPLVQRDVIAPTILEPNSSSVWPIGTQQTVIWDTSNFPPVSQITNPIGQIILGFNESNSLNLDFNHPLAQNFELTDGNVMITVPNVPPREDYLIVLFGDSGDTSPAFAITRISSPDSGNASSSTSLGFIPDPSIAIPTSLSITGSVTPSVLALTESTTTGADITTAPLSTGTTAASSSSSSSSSSTSAVALASAASTPTSAGRSLHRDSRIWSSAAPFLMSVASLVFII